MGTDAGGLGDDGGLADVSVITLPPHAGSNSRAKMMGEIRSIQKVALDRNYKMFQDLQERFC
jgi:hypothetical protein